MLEVDPCFRCADRGLWPWTTHGWCIGYLGYLNFFNCTRAFWVRVFIRFHTLNKFSSFLIYYLSSWPIDYEQSLVLIRDTVVAMRTRAKVDCRVETTRVWPRASLFLLREFARFFILTFPGQEGLRVVHVSDSARVPGITHSWKTRGILKGLASRVELCTRLRVTLLFASQITNALP